MRVVVVAPHSDDEVLGAGGAIAAFADAGATVTVITVCNELPPIFPPTDGPIIHAEARAAHDILGVHESIFFDYPAVALNEVPVAELNGRMLDAMLGAAPDVVLLPFPDRHVDHRIVCESAVVATRPYREGVGVQFTAMYETISETFWNIPGAEPTFSPHWSLDITSTLQRKLDAFAAMPSRVKPFPGPRSVEALHGLAAFRGSQASCGFAESFQLVRTSLTADALVRTFA